MPGMAPDVNALFVVPKFNPCYVLLLLLVHLILLVHVFFLILLNCTLIFRSSFRHGKALDSYALHICIVALNQI